MRSESRGNSGKSTLMAVYIYRPGCLFMLQAAPRTVLQISLNAQTGSAYPRLGYVMVTTTAETFPMKSTVLGNRKSMIHFGLDAPHCFETSFSRWEGILEYYKSNLLASHLIAQSFLLAYTVVSVYSAATLGKQSNYPKNRMQQMTSAIII